MSIDFQKWTIQNIKKFFNPLVNAINSDEALKRLLTRLGWDPYIIQDSFFRDLRNRLDEIINVLENISTEKLSSLEDILHVINAVKNFISKIDEFANPFDSLNLEPSLNPTDLIQDLFSLLIIDYLYYSARPSLFFLLELLDIFTQESDDRASIIEKNSQNIVFVPPQIPRINLSKIVNLITNPIDTLKKAYLPPSGTLLDAQAAKDFSDKLFPRLASLLVSFGFDSHYGLTGYNQDNTIKEKQIDRTLYLTYYFDPENIIKLDFLILSKSELDNGPALQVGASGLLDLDYTINNNWILEIKTGGQLPSMVISSSGVSFPDNDAKAQLRVSVIRLGTNNEPVLLLGSKTGTRFEVGLCRMEAFFDSQGPDFGIGFYANNCVFILDTASADGFLKKILPEKGIQANIDFGISWSQRKGFQICGNLGLEIDLPLHFSILDIITLDSLSLALLVKSDSLSVAAGLSTSVKLGPVAASVRKVGLEAAYGFNDSPNKGFHFNFKPPTGIGLSIACEDVLVGGGFINFDSENERYFGALALKFMELGISAIGLITTKLPDGSKGFSMLIKIGVEFYPPLQLSMGFTLNAVGGLVGVNRSLQVDVLRAGIKNHTLDSILFADPDTVVVKANEIISNLQSVFPAEEGQYVVGPMVRIGWGSSLITADIGVFIQFPELGRILLLGQLNAGLPSLDQALIEIHLDIIGVIDFAIEELTFSASLYDSRILCFDMSGDAAMLVGWGNNPRFVLSMGGFFPGFETPKPDIIFADMKRLSIAISFDKFLSLTCSSYYAITPNTLQFGAKAELYVAVYPFELNGYVGFDALFCISPFAFFAQGSAGVALSIWGIDLFGIGLKFFLSGPNPWNARGTVWFSILWFDFSQSFNLTWGDEEQVELPTLNPWDCLKAALENPDNWGSYLPSEYQMVVTLRSQDKQAETGQGATKEVLVDPFGTLEVREQVCPFDMQLEKFNNAPVEGYNEFTLNGFTVGESDILQGYAIEEFFAPGLFQDLSIDEKLSKPSFEMFKAGICSRQDTEFSLYKNDEGNIEVESVELTYNSVIYGSDISVKTMLSKKAESWDNLRHVHQSLINKRCIIGADNLRRFSLYHRPLEIKVQSLVAQKGFKGEKVQEETVVLRPMPFGSLKDINYRIVNTNTLEELDLSAADESFSKPPRGSIKLNRTVSEQKLKKYRRQKQTMGEQADEWLVVEEMEVLP